MILWEFYVKFIIFFINFISECISIHVLIFEIFEYFDTFQVDPTIKSISIHFQA